jgi:hypothetical protein
MAVVRTYEPKHAEREMNPWLQLGWQIQNVSEKSGHLNVGRTVLPALATGGVSLLFGGSRSSDLITVTYLGSGLDNPELEVLQSSSSTPLGRLLARLSVGLFLVVFVWEVLLHVLTG